jgi:RNA polymerase sigma factor (TIGR02999 family)
MDSAAGDAASATPPLAGKAGELLPLVYEELRRMAAQRMLREAPGQTLQATALVHDAWLKLGDQSFENRAHFFGAAAQAMRRILVDRAREKKALKRGGDLRRVEMDGLDGLELASPLPDDQLLALDEALDRLATVDTRAAEMVKLCFFVGLTQEEAAGELGVSLATAERVWGFARAWLLREVRRTTQNE